MPRSWRERRLRLQLQEVSSAFPLIRHAELVSATIAESCGALFQNGS
jgi:hypothetical protein